MQLIPLDLGDKSQCAVAAGLFWQPRWLGFLLHFHKMSSGHGSVRCLAVFFTHFCLRSLMLFIKRNSNSAGVKGTLTQGNKTAFPHMNWRHVRYIQFKLHNLPPQPSRTNQLTVSSLWKCLMLFILFRNDSNTFYSFCCHLFQTFIISSQLATSLLAYTGPNIEPSRPSISINLSYWPMAYYSRVSKHHICKVTGWSQHSDFGCQHNKDKMVEGED